MSMEKQGVVRRGTTPEIEEKQEKTAADAAAETLKQAARRLEQDDPNGRLADGVAKRSK